MLPPTPWPVGLYKPCFVVERRGSVSGHRRRLPDGTRSSAARSGSNLTLLGIVNCVNDFQKQLPVINGCLILGYEEEQQKEINTWTAGLGLTRPSRELT